MVAKVVDKFIMELEAQLEDRSVMIELTDAERAWLATKGYDKLYGARPLSRVIKEHIKKPLAEELLFGKLAKGGLVMVDIEDEKPVFTYPKPKGGPGKGKGKKKPAYVE